MPDNTRGNEDREIEQAIRHGEEANEHIINLVNIIQSLDSRLTDAHDRIEELSKDLQEATLEVSRLERELETSL